MVYAFWIILILITYCYFGYPFIVFTLSKIFPKRVDKRPFTPAVSFVMSVWNEEDVIESKIKNIFSLDYPGDKIEILAGSDGSTDGTNDILRRYAGGSFRFFEFNNRRGKMEILNELTSNANGEIIIFTDARQCFHGSAVRELAANFFDPKVGCVSGELVFGGREGGTAKGINLYWNYEKFIRRHESMLHSMLGATGAIYAIRKELFTPIPKQLVLDDVWVPLNIVLKGYRGIFDEKARAYDEVADSPKEESRRKARTLFGNYQIFQELPGVLNPFKSPVAVQMFSHKMLRLFVPFLMIALFLLNAAMLPSVLFKIFFMLQIIFYVTALIGALARDKKYGMLKGLSRVCYVPYVFCLLNFSALMGFIRFITKKQEVTWVKARA